MRSFIFRSDNRKRNSVGFTLVELLVVITIIGILIALLLPAVQAAREAARRLQCSNNLKQLGLAQHNYVSQWNVFPAGATTLTPRSGWGTGYGISWRISILPFLEQASKFDQLNFNCACGGGDMDSGVNAPALDDFAPAAFICPSSRMNRFSKHSVTQADALLADYAGVAGADGNDPLNRYNGSGGNVAAYNGILFANSAVRMADVRDGTTNVLMLAEQSEWGADAMGAEVDCRSSGIHGAWNGTYRIGYDTSMGDWASDRVFNTTTIGRPLGTRFCEFVSDYTGSPYYTGGKVTGGDNRTPVLSAHANGANVAMADGSVQFLSETINFQLFQLLAIRDSGKVKEWD